MKIGAGSANPINARTYNQSLALKRDVSQAQQRNVNTFGRQNQRGVECRTTPGPEEARVVLARPALQKEEPPSAKAVETTEVTSTPPTKSQLEMTFLNTLSQELPDADVRSLSRQTQQSLLAISKNGGQAEPSPVLAAHTYNHAKRTLSDLMPGAGLNEIRKAARGDAEVGAMVRLMDSSAALLRSTKRETARQPREQELPAPDTSSVALAEMMAERQKTILSVGETLTNIAAERMKTAAQIHQIEAETNQTISDIYMQIFTNRARAASEGHKKQVYLTTEVWPD